MMLTFTPVQMADYWLRGLGIQLATDGSTVQGEPAEAIRQAVTDRMQAWYAALLRQADPALLPVRDMRSEATVASGGDNCLRVELPASGAQLVAAQVSGWAAPLRRFASLGSALHRRQRNVWLRASLQRPAGVLDGRQLLLYGLYEFQVPDAPSSAALLTSGVAPDLKSRLSLLLMTAWPADGSYVFDASLAPDFTTITL